jgi:hypothetical protein
MSVQMEPTDDQIIMPAILTGGIHVYPALPAFSVSTERKTDARQGSIAHLVHQSQSRVPQATTVLLVRLTPFSAVRDITILQILALTIQIVCPVRLGSIASFRV